MRKFLVALLGFYSFQIFGQMEIDGKPLTQEQREMAKDAFSKEKILEDFSKNSCACIDSISINNKTARDNAAEIGKCIDKQVVVYQQALTILKAADLKEGDSLTLSIYTNPKSATYIRHYREIEKSLMENCEAVKKIVGRDNVIKSKSVSQNPDARKDYNRAIEFYKVNDYKNAIIYFESAVSIDPDFAFAWDNIGVCARNLGDYKKALKAYRKSLELVPDGKTALQNIPLVYVSQGDYKKAIKAYDDLAGIDSGNPEVFYGKGLVYFNNLKDFDLALDNMCKAYSIYTKHNSPYRVDAEKVIGYLYKTYKEQNKEADFNRILKANGLSSE